MQNKKNTTKTKYKIYKYNVKRVKTKVKLCSGGLQIII